jgi:hypothetical protein
VNVGQALRALESPVKPGSWLWTFYLAREKHAVPPIPHDRLVDVPQSDPTWKAKLAACNARIR